MSSTPPKYLQIAQEMEARLVQGEWSEGRMPTVRDVAKRHQVSIVTASRALQVLRDQGHIRAVERSGSFIIPNKKLQRAQRWGLCLRVTPNPWQEETKNIIRHGFRHLQQSSSHQFREDLFTFSSETSSDKVVRQARALKKDGLRGIFLLPSRVSVEETVRDEWILQACREVGLPVVLLERNLRGDNRPLEHDVVTSDDLTGGRVITEHLVRLGRRKIVFVTGSPCSSHRDRVAGYLQALHESEQARQPQVIEQLSALPPKESHRQLAEAVLEAEADGVVCYEDYTAVGLIVELFSRGISVPRDVAVAGFDDLPIGNVFTVGVTTYVMPSKAMAEEALRLMQARQSDPERVPVKVVLSGELVIRESTKD